jgi:hypothetical protein
MPGAQPTVDWCRSRTCKDLTVNEGQRGSANLSRRRPPTCIFSNARVHQGHRQSVCPAIPETVAHDVETGDGGGWRRYVQIESDCAVCEDSGLGMRLDVDPASGSF